MEKFEDNQPPSGFYIGTIFIPVRVVMAPMAGLTNGPFRKVAHEAGCRAFWTEMITSEGLIRKRDEISTMLPDPEDPHPVAVQIFGANKDAMGEAAVMAEAAGADAVDINMACPVRRITRIGAGAALMRNLIKAAGIVRAAVKRVSIPVTVKIRAGWDNDRTNALELAHAVVEEGAGAVIIHGRTRAQGFSGSANHDIAGTMVTELNVPVIVSGDITSCVKARKVLDDTGAAAVMIGRACVGDPWIFIRVSRFLQDGTTLPRPSDEEKYGLIIRHLDLLEKKFGERKGLTFFRAHLAAYLKGRPDASKWRKELLTEKVNFRLKEEIKKAFKRSG